MTDRLLTFHAAGGAEAVFDLAAGGRLGSLRVDGTELLVSADEHPMRWGSYPMVPWAGRIRHGRFDFDGTEHRMPITLGPHAIHGTAYTLAWDRVDHATMGVDLVHPWPYPARLQQSAVLTDSSLRVTLELAAEVTQPAMLGWHPWFRRTLERVGASDATLHLLPGAMYELDHEMIPTGKLIEPSDPPWDNCFVNLASPPRLTWPGFLELEIDSDCTHWTVFTEPEHAMCIEPQTEAPDVFNRTPAVVEAGRKLTATMELRWRLL